MDKLFDKFGKGIKFPFNFGETGGVGIILQEAGLDKIRQSIMILLGTYLGERLFNPEFGSRLSEVPFEFNDEYTKDLLYLYTAKAIERWENRVKLVNVSFEEDKENNMLGIVIELKLGDIRTSLVFPFNKSGLDYNKLFGSSEILTLVREESNL